MRGKCRPAREIERRENGEGGLPLLGPLSYALSGRNGDDLSGECRTIAEAERMVSSGDFERASKLYGSVHKGGSNFLSFASVSLIAAIGSGNVRLFDRILSDIDAFPRRYGAEEAKQAVEIVRTWLGLTLYSSAPCPPYIEELDLAAVPKPWQRQVAYLAIKRLERRGESRTASVLADALLNLAPGDGVRAEAADIHLFMAKALIARLEGRMADAERWCRAAVTAARDGDIVLPFLGLAMGPKTVIERAFVDLAPELLAKIKNRTNGFFRNLLKFHNRYTGESVNESLLPRQVFLASSLKQGFRYNDIAIRLGVTRNRLHDMVQDLYEDLGIGKRTEIGSKVW